jgi:hypothetical protein
MAALTRDRRRRGLELAFTATTGAIAAIPTFLISVGLVYLLAVTFRVFPVALDDEEENRLCPPVVLSRDVADLARLAYAAMQGQVARVRHEAVGPWTAESRLNPARAALDHIGEPDVGDSLAFMIEHTRDALENLGRRATESTPHTL